MCLVLSPLMCNVLGVVSFDVTLLKLFDASCVVFKDRRRDINDGIKIAGASKWPTTALSQKHSRVSLCKVKISAWLDKVATKVCLVDLQKIAMPSTVKT